MFILESFIMLYIDMKMHVYKSIYIYVYIKHVGGASKSLAKEVLRIAAPDSGTISTAPCTLVGSLLG